MMRSPLLASINNSCEKANNFFKHCVPNFSEDPDINASLRWVAGVSAILSMSAVAPYVLRKYHAAKQKDVAPGVNYQEAMESMRCAAVITDTITSLPSDEPLPIGAGPFSSLWQTQYDSVKELTDYWTALCEQFASKQQDGARVPASTTSLPPVLSESLLDSIMWDEGAIFTPEESSTLRWYLHPCCGYLVDADEITSLLDEFNNNVMVDFNAMLRILGLKSGTTSSATLAAQDTFTKRIIAIHGVLSVIVFVHSLRQSIKAIEQRSHVVLAQEALDAIDDVDGLSALQLSSRMKLHHGEAHRTPQVNAMILECVNIRKHVVQHLRSLHVRNGFSLVGFMAASVSRRLVGTMTTAGLAALTSKMALAGHSLRQGIEAAVCAGTFTYPSARRVIGLCGWELLRLSAQASIGSLNHHVVSVFTAESREKTKAALFDALTRAPIRFYDLVDEDEVEQIVYYVNDLEGVDVHLQHHIMALVETGVSCYAAASVLRDSNVLLRVLAAIAIGKGVEKGALALARKFRKQYRDAEEMHNSGGADGSDSDVRRFLLRGLEIIENVRALRPLGTDTTLMRKWNEHVGKTFGVDNAASPTLSNEDEGHRSWLPSLRNALARHGGITLSDMCCSAAVLSKFLLPFVVAGVVQTKNPNDDCFRPILVAELLSSITDFADTLLDSKRIVELLQLNAHKAHTLMTLLDEGQWEGYEDPEKMKMLHDTLLAPSGSGSRWAELRMKGVDFSYPSRSDVHVLQDQNVVVSISNSKVTAIKGRSGSGKSTLLSLMLRLYEPDAGVIELATPRADAVRALSEVPHSVVRNQLFSYVPQNPVVFHGTIAQNIALQPNISVADSRIVNRIEKVAAAAGCDYIAKMPEGIFTVIGGSGSQLSGGEAQRLAIARAMFKNAQVILLDEPTSALDGANRGALLQSLRKWAQRDASRAVIMVTHDDAVADAADEVLDFTSHAAH